MSLSKQLFLFVSVLFLIIFSLNFILSVNNIKSYLEIESQVHAQDTATSLGLSLSPYIANEADPVMETMINAIFDMGYYREIKLVNPENKSLVFVTNKSGFNDVPQWFVDLLPMKLATASSEISSGWNIGGIIYVTINPGYAYLKLFEQVKSTLIYSFITFVVAIFLLVLVLRFILLPLQTINNLALTIADGQFATIDQLPWTKEVRNVAISMNIMSRKLEGVISSLNSKLEGLGKKLLLDDLTRLLKRSSFETDMKQLTIGGDAEAYIFLIKIDSLATLTKEHGPESIDIFLKKFANNLIQLSEQYASGVLTAYRFFGAEFALLAQSLSNEQAESVAKQVSKILSDLAEEYNRTDIGHIGVTRFNSMRTLGESLLAANEAYEQAQLIGANSYYFRTTDDHAKDIEAWKDLVFKVVDQQAYSVVFASPVIEFKSSDVLIEDAQTQVCDSENNEIVPIGIFVSIAEKFSKIVDLDQGVTEKAIDYIINRAIRHEVAISLSTRTVKNADFRAWLAEHIGNQAIAKQLVFSVSAYAVAKETAMYKEFIEFIHSLGAKVMLRRFETQSLSLEMAKALKPDYIRLARELSNGLSFDHGKRHFVETMQEIANLVDIVILAENVLSDDDYRLIKSLGLAGASR